MVNRTDSYADVEFIAFGKDDNEVARETPVVGPNIKIKLSLQEMFPELSLSDLSTVHSVVGTPSGKRAHWAGPFKFGR